MRKRPEGISAPPVLTLLDRQWQQCKTDSTPCWSGPKKLLHDSEPRFAQLYNGNNNRTHLTGLP